MFVAAAHLLTWIGTIYNIAAGEFPNPQHFSTQSLRDAQSTILFVFLVVAYYLILACVHHRAITVNSKTRPSELPHTQHQCFYCCVKSEGRVAEIRLSCLFLAQSLALYGWSYSLWIREDLQTAQQLIIVNEIFILLSWYHLLKTSTLHSLLYLVNVGIFIFFGIYTTHAAFSQNADP